MSNEEVTQASEVELGSQDAGVLRSRVEAYTKQRDELLQKAQALHGEVEFCNRMLDIIGENGTVEEE
jgi:hypothetical protein